MLATEHSTGGDPCLFMKVSKPSVTDGTAMSWIRFSAQPEVNASVEARLRAGPIQELYLAPSIGHGVSGVCFKALVSNGKNVPYLLRVAKVFRLDPSEDQLDAQEASWQSEQNPSQECERWMAAYDEVFDVRTFDLSSKRCALVMPYFPPFEVRDEFVLGKVRTTLQTNFDNRGLVHEDVKWRHVGHNDDGSKAVVFDLGRVRAKRAASGGGASDDDGWVDECVSELRAELEALNKARQLIDSR